MSLLIDEKNHATEKFVLKPNPFPVDDSLLDRMNNIVINKPLFKAITMIDKDSRLDAPDKDAVIAKVKARLPEVGKNGLALGDVVKQEADKLLAEKAKALTAPLQIDAEAAVRIIHTHGKEMMLADYGQAQTLTEAEVVAAIKAIPKFRLGEKMNPNHKPESELCYAVTIRQFLQSFADGISEYGSVREAARAKLAE